MINNETFYINKIENLSDLVCNDSKMPKFFKKIIGLFYTITNRVKVRKIDFHSPNFISNIEDIKMILLPIKNIDKIKPKKVEKISNKLIKKLKEYPAENIVLSEKLDKLAIIKNKLYSYNFNILDGRWLFKYITDEIFEYIFSIQKTSFEKEEIAILVNETTDINIEIIKSIATKCRVLNIVTNKIDSFNFIEKYLNDNFGVVINLTTNYKKGILKSGIVLNLDFPMELLNKCVFSKYALIINFENEVKIYSKSFEGVNINFYKILMPIKYRKIANEMKNFSEEVLYESFLYSKRRYDFIRKQILDDKLRIKELLGTNGKIKIEEFSKVKKFQNINPKRRKSTKRLDKIKY